MADKLSPEEQLLRLIESDEKVNKTSLTEQTVIAPSSAKEKTAARPLSERIRSVTGWFIPKSISLKIINRFLIAITIVLSVYLIWEISQTQISSADILKELQSGAIDSIRPAELPQGKDLIDYTKPVEARNVFKPIPKPVPPPIDNTPAYTTPTNTTTVVDRTPPYDPMIEELKKKYKLKGVVIKEFDPDNQKIIKEAIAIIESEDGKDAYIISSSDGSIQGTVTIGETKLNYLLRIKEIKKDTIVLIEENSKKEMELNLIQ